MDQVTAAEVARARWRPSGRSRCARDTRPEKRRFRLPVSGRPKFGQYSTQQTKMLTTDFRQAKLQYIPNVEIWDGAVPDGQQKTRTGWRKAPAISSLFLNHFSAVRFGGWCVIRNLERSTQGERACHRAVKSCYLLLRPPRGRNRLHRRWPACQRERLRRRDAQFGSGARIGMG